MSETSDPGRQWMDLADAITSLRDQIVEAQERLAFPTVVGHQAVLFTLGEITLDLGLELVGTKGVDGGLRWGVVSVGGTRENGRTATHTVTVKLQPHRPDGGDIDVSDED